VKECGILSLLLPSDPAFTFVVHLIHFLSDLQVICSLCDWEQNVQQVCENCGVCMGEYFCSTCKFYDDEVSLSWSPIAIEV
jgi:hypothetical protein